MALIQEIKQWDAHALLIAQRPIWWQRVHIRIAVGTKYPKKDGHPDEDRPSGAKGDPVNDPPKSLGPFATRDVYERARSLQVGEEFTLELS